ncbi:hypothetical protein MTO96_044275, partial [Rhipicephalus appendiculatus]
DVGSESPQRGRCGSPGKLSRRSLLLDRLERCEKQHWHSVRACQSTLEPGVERRKSAAGQQTRTEPKDFVDRLTRRNGELLQEQNSKESRRDRMRQREGWSGGAPEAPEDFVATRVGDETDATATDNGTGRRITER